MSFFFFLLNIDVALRRADFLSGGDDALLRGLAKLSEELRGLSSTAKCELSEELRGLSSCRGVPIGESGSGNLGEPSLNRRTMSMGGRRSKSSTLE
jgi:hypothetical protein